MTTAATEPRGVDVEISNHKDLVSKASELRDYLLLTKEIDSTPLRLALAPFEAGQSTIVTDNDISTLSAAFQKAFNAARKTMDERTLILSLIHI